MKSKQMRSKTEYRRFRWQMYLEEEKNERGKWKKGIDQKTDKNEQSK